jgi:dihydroxyacetone kinase-like protein
MPRYARRPSDGEYEVVTKAKIVAWLTAVGSVLSENREYLTKLDAALGDADHGINMDRGFKKVGEVVSKNRKKDIGSILKDTGMVLISAVGGASGPLYGSFFLRAGSAVSHKITLNVRDILDLWGAGLNGVIDRGKAQPGDKTMVDALAPGVDALQKEVEQGKDIVEAVTIAVHEAEKGMRSTIPMLAKKGRASYLGERSVGHQDPGATSSYFILKTFLDVISH